MASDLRFEPASRHSQAAASLEAAAAADRLHATELVDQIAQRLAEVAQGGEGRMLTQSDVWHGDAKSLFTVRWRASEPERTLSIEVDPLMGAVFWAFHYAGAMMREQREPLSDFDMRRLDELLRWLADEEAWVGGSMAIREDRTT